MLFIPRQVGKRGLSVSYYHSVWNDFGTGSNSARIICVCRWGFSEANV